jgi:hypothetical protein
MPELICIGALMSLLRGRLRDLRADERGSVTTEQVIITAVLAALAIAVTAIIVVKVTGKANSIPTE